MPEGVVQRLPELTDLCQAVAEKLSPTPLAPHLLPPEICPTHGARPYKKLKAPLAHLGSPNPHFSWNRLFYFACGLQAPPVLTHTLPEAMAENTWWH